MCVCETLVGCGHRAPGLPDVFEAIFRPRVAFLVVRCHAYIQKYTVHDLMRDGQTGMIFAGQLEMILKSSSPAFPVVAAFVCIWNLFFRAHERVFWLSPLPWHATCTHLGVFPFFVFSVNHLNTPSLQVCKTSSHGGTAVVDPQTPPSPPAATSVPTSTSSNVYFVAFSLVVLF